ncbi:MAG TPA: altronate dehydratase family protein [Sphingomicrobium sp.]|nr:altronate dehydratase family protein [Sphingomicrobium sp.]
MPARPTDTLERAAAAIRVHASDNVGVALRPLEPGERVEIAGSQLTISDAIEQGHKFALDDIGADAIVRKFAWPIGRATSRISAGAHVHTHNLSTLLKDEEQYEYEPLSAAALPSSDATFMGYRRADGRVGTRNEVWILPTVGCVSRTAERIAALAHARHSGVVDGAHAFTHPFGCSQLGDDLAGTRSVLAALACNPNAGGVLIVGLGCESNQLDALLSEIPDALRDRVRTLKAQAEEDETEAGLAMVDALVATASAARREPVPVSELVIGLKCGGSDGFSGLTANPLVGRISDLVVGSGGSAVLTEIPEIFGAERMLMTRVRDRSVFDALVAVVNDFKGHFLAHGQPVSENPSPGNIAGGITTLEEKSLGAVQKGGHAPVSDVLRYGARVRRKGLSLLEAPGNDAVSSTALAAAGATMILFTTGRGTPLGFPVPTVKIATNSALARRKKNWIDFDAGNVLDREIDAIAAELMALITSIASGEQTASERNDEREIAIWKRGVTL